MPEWIQALILISSGIGLGLICFIVGSWVMYRGKVVPGTGEGFLKDPKGDVFRIPADASMVDGPPGSEEPGPDEQRILNKANEFMKVLGGKK